MPPLLNEMCSERQKDYMKHLITIKFKKKETEDERKLRELEESKTEAHTKFLNFVRQLNDAKTEVSYKQFIFFSFVCLFVCLFWNASTHTIRRLVETI
jgi:uncharacterized membrane protein YheB (UPF0754 family)